MRLNNFYVPGFRHFLQTFSYPSFSHFGIICTMTWSNFEYECKIFNRRQTEVERPRLRIVFAKDNMRDKIIE